MTKKPRTTLWPSFALALVAIAAPILAAIAPLYAAERAHSIFDIRLFSPFQFRLERRKLHPASLPEIPRGKPGTQTPPSAISSPSASSDSSVSSMSSSSSSESSVSSSSSSDTVLLYEHLTGEQRDTLRRQLRSNACPEQAEKAYLELCRRMLRAQPAKKYVPGLTNPNQSE